MQIKSVFKHMDQYFWFPYLLVNIDLNLCGHKFIKLI